MILVDSIIHLPRRNFCYWEFSLHTIAAFDWFLFVVEDFYFNVRSFVVYNVLVGTLRLIAGVKHFRIRPL